MCFALHLTPSFGHFESSWRTANRALSPYDCVEVYLCISLAWVLKANPPPQPLLKTDRFRLSLHQDLEARLVLGLFVFFIGDRRTVESAEVGLA